MKKLRNLFLIAIVCLTGVLFTDKVLASAVVEYPIFSGEILYDKVQNSVCYQIEGNCKKYVVSEDLGITSENFKVTNVDDQDDVMTLYKLQFTLGYVVKSSKQIKIDFPYEEIDGEVVTGEGGPIDEPQDIEGAKKVVYIKKTTLDDALNLIKNADEFDYFVIKNSVFSTIEAEEKELIIPKNVTLMVSDMPFIKKISNNGILETGAFVANEVSGTGVINIHYFVPFGDGMFTGTPLEYASRIWSNNISGIKLNIADKKIKEGISFGMVGPTADISKEEAQKIIDMYNKVLGDTLSGYEVKLMVAKTNEQSDMVEDYYYGSLVKKATETTTVKKEEVKNPKTGDAVLYIVGAIILSASALVVSYKKIRQN